MPQHTVKELRKNRRNSNKKNNPGNKTATSRAMAISQAMSKFKLSKNKKK